MAENPGLSGSIDQLNVDLVEREGKYQTHI